MSPRTCFRLSALLGLLGAVAMMFGSQPLALAGVVAAGLGFANIWPMLFSITVEEKPDRANELSGLMCMAISGGAIVPLLMGNCASRSRRRWARTRFVARGRGIFLHRAGGLFRLPARAFAQRRAEGRGGVERPDGHAACQLLLALRQFVVRASRLPY